MQQDELARKREAETGACAFARVLAANLAEFLEDDFLIGGGDADAGVADCDFDQTVGEARLERDGPPSGVNFNAFDSRLSRICLTLRPSAVMSATPLSTSRESATPYRVAGARTSVTTASKAIRVQAG